MSEDLTPTAAAPPDARSLLDRLLDEAEAQSPPESGQPSVVPPSEQTPDRTSDRTPDLTVRTSPPPAVGTPPPSGAQPQGANPLGALLSNPAVLSALPVLMENLTPLLGSPGGGVGGSSGATRPHLVDRHTALLCAIKPYLSPHRRETAETVIRLCKVWDALERSGISLTGLLGSMGGTAPNPSEGRGSDVQ